MTDDRLPGKPIELPRLALSLVSLSLVGFSLVLLGQMIWLNGTLRADFATRNLLGVPQRRVLLLAIGAGLALPILATLFALWLRRRQTAISGALQRAATISAPLAVTFVLPGLFLARVAEAKPLFYLTVLMAFGFAFNALLTRAIDAASPMRKRAGWLRFRPRPVVRAVPFVLLLICAAAYALVLGRYAVAHHRLIQTVATDVGIADNVMSNLLHGHFFRAPAQFGTAAGSYLSLHAEYGSLLFLPVYRLHPGAETLLWLQAVLAALGVIPLYLLVAGHLGRKMAFWFGASYLLFAPLQGALLHGFSWFPAVTLFSLTLYYAVESERRWLLLLTLPVLLSLSEAGPLNAFGFGLFLVVSGKRARLGLSLTALSGALVAFNLLRSLRGLGAAEQPELASAIGALLENPVYFLLDLARAVKLTSVLHALAPLCLLPLFELATWPLFIPGLLLTSAGSEFWPSAQLGYANSLIWVPACLLALLFTLREQRGDAQNRSRYLAWVVTLTITQLSHSYDFGALLRADAFGGQANPELFRMSPAGQLRYDQLLQLVRRIPESASVATTNYLVSHVSNHAEAYELSRPYGQPDYILLSSREVTPVRHSLDATFAARQYRVVATSGGEFYLFSRGAEDAETRSAFKQLGIRVP
jgi:uncharacterized membrane protein